MFIVKNMHISSLDLSKKRLSALPYDEIDLLINWLILSDNRIEEIDDDIRHFTKLTRLALNDNKIATVSKRICECTNINWIDLTRNKLRILPDEFGDLTKITGLGLSENNFETIPKAIYKLVNLRKFGFFSNQITYISPDIKFLTTLVKIDLSNNKIKEIPDELTQLTNLCWLNLSNNKIKRLPANINRLIKLEELGLGMNELEELPEMSNLNNLRILPVFKNKIKYVHPTVFRMNRIEKLDFSDNEIDRFPYEALKTAALKYLNLRNNKISEIDVNYIKEIKSSNIHTLDISENRLKALPFKMFRIFNDNAVMRLGNNPYELKEAIKPSNINLVEICFSSLLRKKCKMGEYDKILKKLYKKVYMCDCCGNEFVTEPYKTYAVNYIDNGDEFVIERMCCSEKCSNQ